MSADNLVTYEGGKDKTESRVLLGQLSDADAIEKKYASNADGDMVRLSNRGGFPEIVTIKSNKPVDVEKKLTGGFVFSPKDGIETVSGANQQYAWNPAYGSTVRYSPARKNKLMKRVRESATDIDIRLNTKRRAKHVSWFGDITEPDGSKRECVISWDHGLNTRYRISAEQDCSGRVIKIEDGVPELANSGTPGVCVDGDEIKTVTTKLVGSRFVEIEINVVGAGVFQDKLIIASHVDLEVAGESNKVTKAYADCRTLSLFCLDGRSWSLIGRHVFSSPLKAPWFFSPDGSKAVAIKDAALFNQSLLEINISVGQNGEIITSANESSLDSIPFVVSTNDAPIEATEYSGMKWLPPGSWNTVTGAKTLAGGIIIDWMPSQLDSDSAYYAAAAAYVAIGGSQLTKVPGRVSSISQWFPAATADWSVSDYSVIETYIGVNAYGNPMVQSDALAYRNTYGIISESKKQSTFPRSATGTRFICADFDFSGEKLIFKERLVGDACSFYFSFEELIKGEKLRSSPSATQYIGTTSLKRHYSISGKTSWEFCVNDSVVFSAEGGTNSTIVADHEKLTRSEQSSFGAGNIPGSSTTNRSYSPAAGSFFSERIWVIDADLRSGSFVYEKTKEEFQIIPFGDEDSAENYFETRIPCLKTEKSSIHLLANGIEHDQEQGFTLGEDQPVFVRPYSFMLETLPRAHDLDSKVEEDSQIPKEISWTQGTTPLSAKRYWGFDSSLPFDPMPRSANTKPYGQVQTRDPDHTVISTSSITTSRLQPSPISQSKPIELHPVTYHTRAYFKGFSFDILGSVSQKINADSATNQGIKSVGDGFRLYPVKAT